MKTAATKPAVSATFSSADYLRRLMTELDRAEISRRIALARTNAGLTQPELGDVLDVHWRTVQVWERGESLKSKGIHRLFPGTASTRSLRRRVLRRSGSSTATSRNRLRHERQ